MRDMSRGMREKDVKSTKEGAVFLFHRLRSGHLSSRYVEQVKTICQRIKLVTIKKYSLLV